MYNPTSQIVSAVYYGAIIGLIVLLVVKRKSLSWKDLPAYFKYTTLGYIIPFFAIDFIPEVARPIIAYVLIAIGFLCVIYAIVRRRQANCELH